MRIRPVPLAALVLPLLLSACDDDRCDEPCPLVACIPPFVLAVTDAQTGEPISGASATSPGLACPATAFPASVQCDARAGGTFEVTVSAPGHVARQIAVTVDPPVATGACECPVCQDWQPLSVALAPAG